MKHILVTGCAGFIGSTLAEKLLSLGYHVTGVDCFTDNYTKWIKNKNLEELVRHPNFTWIQANLLSLNLKVLIQKQYAVFHQAAIPGVRSSWGEDFKTYVDYNILATQKLLEAVKDSKIVKMIYASSSSIYGQSTGPTKEIQTPAPYSPYGVTKLSGEHLCQLYYKNYGVPVVSLRYFTVYGPKQRPDMAFHKFIRNILANKEITIYGDGKQTRDFTYIDDAVLANLLAMEKGRPGEAYNIGGCSRVELLKVIQMLGKLMDEPPILQFSEDQPGDPKHTWADIEKARIDLTYNPSYPLEKGLENQIAYIQSLYLPNGNGGIVQ